jgi:hypothetical protein
MDEGEVEAIYEQVLRAIVEDPDRPSAPPRCCSRISRCDAGWRGPPPLDLNGFARRLSCARAGIFDVNDPDWQEALALAGMLPDDMLGAFLLVARAAGRACPPPDTKIAETYGTSSLGRVKRLIAYIESRDLFVCRTDLTGKRSITIPGWAGRPRRRRWGERFAWPSTSLRLNGYKRIDCSQIPHPHRMFSIADVRSTS